MTLRPYIPIDAAALAAGARQVTSAARGTTSRLRSFGSCRLCLIDIAGRHGEIGDLTLDGKKALKTLLSANKRLNTAYVLKESFGPIVELRARGLGATLLRELARRRIQPISATPSNLTR